MTKSLIITFDETDESFLMILFNKFKIKTQIAVSPVPQLEEDLPQTKEAFLNDLRESVAEMKAHQRGEIQLPSFEDSIKRIEQELAQEELISI